MSGEDQRSRVHQEWADERGFKMLKIYPADWETAIAELYFGDQIWAYVSLQGVDEAATGAARVRNARAVVEFWREPDKPTGVWEFSLELAGALQQLQRAEAWLIENETGRAPSADEGLGAPGRAFVRMSEQEQERWASPRTDPASEEVDRE
jgi:hypothetical protein